MADKDEDRPEIAPIAARVGEISEIEPRTDIIALPIPPTFPIVFIGELIKALLLFSIDFLRAIFNPSIFVWALKEPPDVIYDVYFL